MTDLTVAILACFGVLCLFAVFGMGPLKRAVRRKTLPMVVREDWTDAEYREYGRKIDAQDEGVSGSLHWQAHCELQRMTDGASSLATSVIAWRSQLAALDADANRLQERAAAALTGGDEGRARQLLADRRAVLARCAALQDDIATSETTLDSYRREITALEDRLGGNLRRELIAKARRDSARDTIRARQLMHGTLAEAAMARLEAREQEATLAESRVEALRFGRKPSLSDAFEDMEIDRDLDAIKSRQG